MASIRISVEAARGCGYRKAGGLYLVGGGPGRPCGKLPIKLDVCPCCGTGIKPARGWTWIDPRPLVADKQCADHNVATEKPRTCSVCPLGDAIPERAGLIWIGEAFYPTPFEWLEEADRMGISRRIAAVPQGFEVGKTWVFVAHRKVPMATGETMPAIFHAYRPSAVEYVVKGTETEPELERLEKRGITLIDVRPIGEDGQQLGLDLTADNGSDIPIDLPQN